MNRATHPDHTVLTTYDELGDIVSVTDQMGRTTAYEYDNLGRQAKETLPDPDGPGSPLLAPETAFEYDAAGNLISVTDPEENTTWYVYDELNRQIRTVDALGTGPGDLDHATVTTYDAVGKVTGVTDPEGNTTAYQYDRLDRLTSETNELDDARSFEYNAAGDLVRQTDRNGRVTEYVYDAVGQLLEERWLDATEEVIHTIYTFYDDAGQLTDVVETDEDGLRTGTRYQYVYDSLGNVVSARMAPGDLAQTEVTQFTDSLYWYYHKLDWDDDGDDEPYDRNNGAYRWDTGDVIRVSLHSDEFDPVLIGVTNFLTPEEWLIDDNSGPGNDAYLEFTVGQETQWWIVRTMHDEFPDSGDYYEVDLRVDVVDPFPFPTHFVEFEYTYDLAGNLLEATDSEGGLTEYDYDDLHRVTQTRQSGTGVAAKRVDFTYLDGGRFDTITRYSDLAGTNEVAETTYSHDGIGRLTALTHEYASTPPTQLDYTWAYDAASRITGTTLPDGTGSFTYDDTNQLLDADHSYQDDEGYTYDDAGNRLTVDSTTTYTTGDANRLTSDGAYNYTYDGEGNRTARFVDNDFDGQLTSGDTYVTEYEWDYRNRLVTVTDRAAAGQGATQVVEYTYDYLNRRIARILDSDGDGTPDEYTYQVHRGDEVALEFTDPDGLANDTTDPTVSHRYFYGAAVDQILAVEDDSGEVLWGLADHQGTIRDVIDSAGNLENHVEYDSFGRPTGGTSASADFLFAFTGRPIDPDTDLYDYRARWYDPDVGRFVSEDPISFAAGDANLYRYVGNSPVIYVDPSGLCYDGFVDTTNSSQQSHQAVDERYSSYPGDVSVPDPATSDGPSTPTAPASGSFWGALGTAWSYASGVGDWAWNHGLAQGIAPLLPFGDILVTQKTAADERARASQVYDNARDAGYSPAGAAGLGGGVVAGDVTGVTGASYWLPGIDTDPVTGRRYSGSERFFRGALGLTQLGLIGYGLGKTFVSPRLGSTNAGGPCFVAGTQVALAAEEQPIMVAALVDGGDGGNAHARDIAGSLLVSAAGVGLVYDCASRRRRRKHRQGHSKPWDGLLTGDHGGAMQPEFEEESVEAPGAADSSQMPDESSLTVAASRRYAELAEDVAVTTDMQRRENPVDTRPPRIRFGPLRWAAVALCLLAGFLWWGGPEPSSTPSSARLVSATAAAAPGLAQPSTKDIEAIRVGDLVLAQDPETGENCAKRVTQVFRHTADHVRVLEIAVGEESGTQTIRTTDNHPFWVPGQDWVDAGELRVGDPVLQSDGHTATITKSHREEHPRGVEVYNFEVEGFHTYFVAANSLNARPVLVHNKPKSYNPGGSQGKAGGPSARHTPGKGHTRKSGPGQKKRFQKKAAEKRSAKQAAKDAARKKWDSLTPEQKKLLPELNPGG